MKTRAKSKRARPPTSAKSLSTKKPAKSKAKKAYPSTAKDDHKMPKKPPTSFFYFLEDFRKTYQQENPDVKSMCNEKVQYYDIATEKRAEFEQAMAAYIKRKESGEFSEESDDYNC